RDEGVRDVDAHHIDAPSGEGERVTTGTAADVEQSSTRFEVEGIDEEADLLLRASRERVPQVRTPEELSDVLEPVRAIAQPLASSQLAPHATLTLSGTDSSHAPHIAASVSSAITSCSSGGTSRMTSSWTCRIRRLARSRSRMRASMRIKATLKMSAANPWIPAFIAWRSPA